MDSNFDNPYGWHKTGSTATGSSPGYDPELLIVFLHGFQGHFRATWAASKDARGEEPHSSSRSLIGFVSNAFATDGPDAIDFDVLSFDYPSRLWEKADYRLAARELRQYLSLAEFRRYRHIVFVVHSTGGLIVKELLLQDADAVERARAAGYLHPTDLDRLIFRTRRIVNLGVPHSGASATARAALTIVSPMVALVGGLCTVAASVWNAAEVGRGTRLGFCRLAFQLTWGSSHLRTQETKYRALLKTLDDLQAPRPVSIDYVSLQDNAIHRERPDYTADPAHSGSGQYDDATVLTLRDTHVRFKQPRGPSDYVVKIVVGQIRAAANRLPLAIADEAVHGAALVDLAYKDGRLVPPTEGEPPGYSQDDDRRATDGSWLGTQHDVFNDLQRRTQASTNGFTAHLVTGAAGVGKSFVLRRLASTSCARFLRTAEMSACPLTAPIFLFKVPDAELDQLDEGAPLWPMVSRWWCDWVTKRLAKRAARLGHSWTPNITWVWLEQMLRQSSTLVILDGLDDFLARNPRVHLRHVRDLLSTLRKECEAAQLTVVLGARSSVSAATLVSPDCVLEIARLGDRDLDWFADQYSTSARADANAVRALLRGSNTTDTRRALVTPLLLKKVLPRAAQLTAADMTTLAAVMEQVLRVNIEHSWADSAEELATRPTVAECMDALSLIGHVYFDGHMVDASPSELVARCVDLVRGWELHSAATQGGPQSHTALRGYRWACDERFVHDILRRSVFFEVSDRFRVHREWEEFLAARYLAQATACQYVDAFFSRGCVTRMYFIVGDLIRKGMAVQLTPHFVSRVFTLAFEAQTGDEPKRTLSINLPGHLYAIVGHSQIPLGGDACAALLAPLAEAPALLSIVALETLGFRCWRRDAADAWWPVLAHKLVEYVRALDPTTCDPYLYLVAWHQGRRCAFQLKQPFDVPCPQWKIEHDSPLLKAALEVVSHQDQRNMRVAGPIEAEFQRIIMELQSDVLDWPGEIVSGVTLLVTVVAASHYQCATADAQMGLRQLFGDTPFGARIAAEVERCAETEPETVELWNRLRGLYEIDVGLALSPSRPRHSAGMVEIEI